MYEIGLFRKPSKLIGNKIAVLMLILIEVIINLN